MKRDKAIAVSGKDVTRRVEGRGSYDSGHEMRLYRGERLAGGK